MQSKGQRVLRLFLFLCPGDWDFKQNPNLQTMAQLRHACWFPSKNRKKYDDCVKRYPSHFRGRGLLDPGVHIISDKNSGTHFPTDTFFLAHQMPPGTSKANQLFQLFLCPEFLVFSSLIGSGSEPFWNPWLSLSTNHLPKGWVSGQSVVSFLWPCHKNCKFLTYSKNIEKNWIKK